VIPPILFNKFHPFFAMLLNEFGVDGFISPHHFFLSSTPESIKGHHKLSYDIQLDAWGFLNSFQPILLKSNPYYYVFEKYRIFLTFLFVYRMVGIFLFYKLRDMRVLAVFPNLFIAAYLAISYCEMFEDRNIKRALKISFFLFYLREIALVSVNEKL
jgi:hypothetical protein